MKKRAQIEEDYGKSMLKLAQSLIDSNDKVESKAQ